MRPPSKNSSADICRRRALSRRIQHARHIDSDGTKRNDRPRWHSDQSKVTAYRPPRGRAYRSTQWRQSGERRGFARTLLGRHRRNAARARHFTPDDRRPNRARCRKAIYPSLTCCRLLSVRQVLLADIHYAAVLDCRAGSAAVAVLRVALPCRAPGVAGCAIRDARTATACQHSGNFEPRVTGRPQRHPNPSALPK